MGNFSLADAAVTYLILLASLSVHEWAHAWSAGKLGDNTARMMGRATLNPIPHMDPVGTVLLPAFFLLLSPGGVFFAWAKPVPVNPSNFAKPVRDDILVSMAGPFSNLLLALGAAVLYGLAARFGDPSAFQDLFTKFLLINALLMVFNLIPVPPLDGSHVLRHLVGMKEETYLKFSQWGFLVLLGLLFLTPFPAFLWQGIRFVATLCLSLTRLIAGG